MLYHFDRQWSGAPTVPAATNTDPVRAGERAERLCRSRGARLTPQRRRVYELVVAAGEPVTAYELLHRLDGESGPPAPPTVYRALEFLQAHGLVHRLASHHRYVACDHPEDARHGGLFLVCRCCGAAREVNDDRVAESVARSAGEAGFALQSAILPEVEGICPGCRDD